MRYFLLISVLLLQVISLNSTPFTNQKAGHCYTLDIPDYMVSTFNLNDVASCQYESTNKVAYTIVIEDSKAKLEDLGIKFINTTEFLSQFTNEYMIDALDRNLGKTTEFVENGNKHSQAELNWTLEGDKYFMIITAVETKTHYYKILSWSLVQNKDSLYNDFMRISKSLKD